ncbi:MAG: DUF839 domain-containing protein [Phycisphaeraceae bacterium]|nr:DUF839 domain-containing protein [Phycisphaeraceae bacterium]
MERTRRTFLKRSAAWGIGFAGLRNAIGCSGGHGRLEPLDPGFGPLLSDPLHTLDLPSGFSYQILSRAGDEMDDGLIVPAKHDGMAAFPGPDGLTILVRNHELDFTMSGPTAFGPRAERMTRIDPSLLYDAGGPAGPCRGGCTTLVYDTKSGREPGELKRHFLSLAGTEYNCAGGPTPRGTWISCEETVSRRDSRHTRDHGYCFEVPASPEPGLARPVPIVAMGRMRHEACATDPRSGIVYMTEDRDDGLIYRYLPNDRDRLLQGGRLQALAIASVPSLDTRNWQSRQLVPGQRLPVEWIDIEDIESPDDSLRRQGFDKGGAKFARGEGMWMGRAEVFFACTTGGSRRLGQIFRLIPGDDGHADSLELFVESPGPQVIENADNVTVAPWGDLIVCEDGPGSQHLLGIRPSGAVYRLATNARSGSEFAGATFSPDGSTLFVNLQGDGMTLAIRGPWTRPADDR